MWEFTEGIIQLAIFLGRKSPGGTYPGGGGEVIVQVQFSGG